MSDFPHNTIYLFCRERVSDFRHSRLLAPAALAFWRGWVRTNTRSVFVRTHPLHVRRGGAVRLLHREGADAERQTVSEGARRSAGNRRFHALERRFDTLIGRG